MRSRELTPRPRSVLDVWPFSARDTWPKLSDIFDFDEVRCEEFRDGDNVVMRFDLPGVDIDKDLSVTTDNGLLQVRAERRHEDEEAGKDYYRSEVRYGTYERTLPLPAGAAITDIKATYADGVLELRIPVPPEDSHKSVVVTRK